MEKHLENVGDSPIFVILLTAAMLPKLKPKTKPKMEAKQIFQKIQNLNPKKSEISSLGSLISNAEKQLSDDALCEILPFLSENSLAKKIAYNATSFSEKQLWVIAFELCKNEDFCKKIASEIEDNNYYDAAAAAKKQAKKQAKSEKKQAEKKVEEEAKKMFQNLAEKKTVKHATYGVGSVTAMTETTVTVFFENFGEKVLLKKIAKLV